MQDGLFILVIFFLLFPVGGFLIWYYYKQDKEKISKKMLFCLLVFLTVIDYQVVFSDIDYRKIRRPIVDFSMQPEMVYLIAVLIVYTILSLIIFRREFLKRMNYWFKKLILYKPKATDYPQAINNLPLIAIFILSIAIVQMTSIYSYVQIVVYEIGAFVKDFVFDWFTVPLIFNFLLYFLFQGILKFIKFLDKRENKQ